MRTRRLAEAQRRVGSNVRHYRQTRGMTQDELAGIIGTTITFLGRIENGAEPPGFATLVRLADALGVDEAELFHPRPSERAKRGRPRKAEGAGNG